MKGAEMPSPGCTAQRWEGDVQQQRPGQGIVLAEWQCPSDSVWLGLLAAALAWLHVQQMQRSSVLPGPALPH